MASLSHRSLGCSLNAKIHPSPQFVHETEAARAASPDGDAAPHGHLEEAATASLDGGVLDAKWSDHPMPDNAAVLACATSTGRLVMYTLREAGAEQGQGLGHAELQQLASSGTRESLLLSLDWSRGGMADAKVRTFSCKGSEHRR